MPFNTKVTLVKFLRKYHRFITYFAVEKHICYNNFRAVSTFLCFTSHMTTVMWLVKVSAKTSCIQAAMSDVLFDLNYSEAVYG